MSEEGLYFGEVRQYWQTDQLYRVEGARRALRAARQRAEAAMWGRLLWDESAARQLDGAERKRRQDEALELRRRWAAEAAQRKVIIERFGGYAGRDRWVWAERLKGRLYREIAAEISCTPNRTRQIFRRYERREKGRLVVWLREVWLPRAEEWEGLIWAREAALAEFAEEQGQIHEQQ